MSSRDVGKEFQPEGRARPAAAPPKDAASHFDEDGPDGSGMAPSKCTDVLCLLAFLVFLGGMGYVMSFALANGNPKRLAHGIDFEGHLCGVSPGYETKPLLFWCPVGHPYGGMPTEVDFKSPICVDSCPGHTPMTVACSRPQQVHRVVKGYGMNKNVTETISYGTQPMQTYATKELGGLYCIPDPGENEALTETLFKPDGPLGSVPNKFMSSLGTLHRCYKLLISATLVAVVLGYVYLFLLRTCADILVMCALGFGTLSILGISGVCLAGEAFKMTGSTSAYTTWESHNLLFRQFDPEQARLYSNVIGGVFGAVFLALLCLLCCARRMIATATGCIEASCECLFNMPSMLIQPLVDVVFKCTVYALLLYGLAYIVSCGDMESQVVEIKGTEVGGLHRTFKHSSEEKGMILYYCFGALWTIELTNSLSQFIISYSVVLWYYKPKPKGFGPHFPLCRGLAVGLTYHLGTLACGAFLIATCRFVRAILTAIAKQAKASGSSTAACCAACCACVVRCVQEFLEQLNKNAYIDVAINSSSFCTAAKDSFAFMAANAGTVALLTGACFIFSFAGILAISSGVAFTSWHLVTTQERWTSDTSPQHVEAPEVVVAVAGALAALVAYCFMMVFDHTSDTLLYVYVWNKEHGHNSVQKYATDKLVAITGYKALDKNKGSSNGGGVFSSLYSSFFGTGTSSVKETEPLVAK